MSKPPQDATERERKDADDAEDELAGEWSVSRVEDRVEVHDVAAGEAEDQKQPNDATSDAGVTNADVDSHWCSRFLFGSLMKVVSHASLSHERESMNSCVSLRASGESMECPPGVDCAA